MDKLRILLTNDDGIYANGLYCLYNELKKDYEVHIVAPYSEMSAVGHAITLHSPLRVQEVYRDGSFYGYAITGTPADCVKIAVQELLRDEPPDIVLSGINLGSNVGIDVLYSGTVSAATEGAYLGIKSAALSLATRKDPDFSFASRFSRQVIKFLLENHLERGVALNVNIPAVPEEMIKGVVFTRQAITQYREYFEKRVDPRGNVYYWLAGEIVIEENGRADTDIAALQNNMITITPISCDLTSSRELERLKKAQPFQWKI
jgi:5'-nucleotidase